MDRLTIQQLDRMEAKLNTLMAIEGVELDEHGFPILTEDLLPTEDEHVDDLINENTPHKRVGKKEDEE